MIVSKGKRLNELLKQIPKYPYYRNQFRLKRDVPFTNEINQKIIEVIRDLCTSLNKKIEKINQLDGCRFDFEGGWILIRRSGTSPYLRISGESNISLEESIKLNKLAEAKMRELQLI